MKVLYHHRTLGDGAEGIHIREMIRAFEALGHSVTTIVPSGADDKPALLPRLIKRVAPRGLFECIAAVHDQVERRRFRRVIRDLRPAFVYVRHALNSIGVLQAADDSGVPAVLEVNALYSSTALRTFEPLWFPRLTRSLEAGALNLADITVVVSSPLQQMVHELTPTARTLTLPNGVDPAHFTPTVSGDAIRRQFGLDRYNLVLGWSGVIRAWHGLDLLLKAMPSLESTALLIIGEGPETVRLRRNVATGGLQDRVYFAGQVSREHMPRYLSAIDVGVVADDRTGYASPMKLVEYMAMSKPVVAPDLPNINDIVRNGIEGLLFPQGNVERLTSSLSELRSSELRTRLGEAGRIRVLQRLNWIANARRVIEAVFDDSHTRASDNSADPDTVLETDS